MRVVLLQGEEVVSSARQVAPRAPCFAFRAPIRPAQFSETSAYKNTHTPIVSLFVVVVFFCRKIRKDTRFTHCSFLAVKQERTHESRAVNAPFLAVKQERTHESRAVNAPFLAVKQERTHESRISTY